MEAREFFEGAEALGKTKSFLSREYLLWLWYASETRAMPFDLDFEGRSYQVSYWVDNKLALYPPDKDGHESILKGGTPARSKEAADALLLGKSIREIKLGFFIEEVGEFTLLLRSADLSPRSMTLPIDTGGSLEVEEGFESSAYFDRKWEQLALLLCSLDTLQAEFLRQRQEPRWMSHEIRKISSWATSRGEKKILH